MTSPHYHLGYRAGSAPCGMAMLPDGMSEIEAGDWADGFIRAAADLSARANAQFEPEVAAVMQRKQETAG